jgi:hypothetical protein
MIEAPARPAQISKERDKLSEIKLGAGDVLRGAEPISEYYSEILGQVIPPKTIYYWFGRGYIPGSKIAGVITTTKTTIREDVSRKIKGQLTPCDHSKSGPDGPLFFKDITIGNIVGAQWANSIFSIKDFPCQICLGQDA